MPGSRLVVVWCQLCYRTGDCDTRSHPTTMPSLLLVADGVEELGQKSAYV